MLKADFHSHSLFSSCGMHTILEMLEAAKARGIKALAITDHGPALGGHINNGVFFKRLKEPVSGIRLLKGIECNLLEEAGSIDCPHDFLPDMDIVLLGIHPNIKTGLGRYKYTEMMLKAMEKNQQVDIITHPNNPFFEVEYEAVASAAVKYGMVLELNNSKSMTGLSPAQETRALIQACKKVSCRVAVSSDAHALNELGRDDLVRSFLEELDFPEELIVNRTLKSAFAFIEERRGNKTAD